MFPLFIIVVKVVPAPIIYEPVGEGEGVLPIFPPGDPEFPVIGLVGGQVPAGEDPPPAPPPTLNVTDPNGNEAEGVVTGGEIVPTGDAGV